MGTYSFSADIHAPRERVFELWTNLARLTEWIQGLNKVTDVTGPSDQVGTSYVAWFGPFGSKTVILEAERPSRYRTKFGNWMLRGENDATFEQVGDATRLTQTFRTVGAIPAFFGRLFAMGSYKGSFRGELNEFKRICEREERSQASVKA